MNRLFSVTLVCLLQLSLAVASKFNLHVEVTPIGSGTLNTSGGTYEEGSSVYLRTYSNKDYVFKGWYEGETLLSSSTGFSYTMPSNDALVQARYEYDPSVPGNPSMPDTTTYYSFTATVSPSGAGSLNTTQGKYPAGAEIYMRTYGNTGYNFIGWQNEKGELVSSLSSFSYSMPNHDSQLTALYIFDPTVPANPDSMATRYTVAVDCKPIGAGSFNTNNISAEEGKNIQLYAYTNTGYRFLRWENEDGEIISTEQNLHYVIPHGNSSVFGIFEFNPANPGNPNKNYWNKELGEVIADDFTPGYLNSAISAVLSGSNRDDVAMITVAGKMNDNDFGIANEFSSCTLLDLSRVTGIAEIPWYAFDGTNLESVYFPATIEKLGDYAFAGCNQLTSLTFYSMTPPTIGHAFFDGIQEGLVIYVPAASIAQYQDADGWKDFTILPIQDDVRSISISLPKETNVQDYAQMWLELTNTKNGQRLHYVMTDRESYTFANIIRNTSWKVVLRNERGDVFGQIDNVEVKDDDVSVSFTTLSRPQNVSMSVLTPDGTDVTGKTQISWTDASGNYIAQTASLSGLPVGYQMNCRVVLSQELALLYETPQIVEYTLNENDNHYVCQLSAFSKVHISGKVKDMATGLPLSSAVISASQTYGGKYSKTLNAKTDRDGMFALEIANVPTSLAYAATDYISQTVDCETLLNGSASVSLPDVSLRSITGATVTLDFTYTTCRGEGIESETQNWYSDYNNISYSLFNVTKDREINAFNVQYPKIVLLEEVEDGDIIQLTATSRVNAFTPVTTKVTIEEQKATATIGITEPGKIQSSFQKTGNASVVGTLYDADGKLVKTYNYSNASLTISNLANGKYTLLSMGSSKLFNTIYDLAQLPQTGLVEGADYVLNQTEVTSGIISGISIPEVPTLDESKLYYTGTNTSFTVNKPSIVAGNYLTLTGRIDFKPEYATSVSNVQMIIDLPESCSFVENSVMVGNSTSSYILNGNQLTIPMTRYTDRVRFCVIPTLGGEFAPSAFAQFDLNNETIIQPIGSAIYTVKNFSISFPNVIANSSCIVSGTSVTKSEIQLYVDNILIGQTTSLANGFWNTKFELPDTTNMKTHSIYAKIIDQSSREYKTEMCNFLYNKNAIEVISVEMINTAHGNSSLDLLDYNTVFDFQNPSLQSKTYWYWPSYPTFSFIVNFTNNNPSKVTNVHLHVKTSDNQIVRLTALYDNRKKAWIATHDFNSYQMPRNVSVTYDVYDTEILEPEHATNSLMQTIGNLSYTYQELGDGMYINNIVSENEKINILCFKLAQSIKNEKKIKQNICDNDFTMIIEQDHMEIYENSIASQIVLTTEDSIYLYAQFDISDKEFFYKYVKSFNDVDKRSNSRVITKAARRCAWPEGNRLQRLLVDPHISQWINMARRKYEHCSCDPELISSIDRLRASFGAKAQGLMANYWNIMQNAGKPDGRIDALNSLYQGGSGAYDITDQVNSLEGLQASDKAAMDYIWKADDCNPNPNGGNGNDNGNSGDGDGNDVQDPSGFVYESVLSNRIQGVTTTAFYKEFKEDMYGDIHENLVKWNAEEYAQENPLFTDENGMYAWDVPQGLWQVKFEKEGYETTYSEWLPVPPPQLDVNIPMKQNVQPNVKYARAFEEAVEFEFDKYMIPELLNLENIIVMADGNTVDGTIELLNEEESYEGSMVTFASKVRFNAAQPFESSEITLMVSNRVESYAGIRMQDDFSQAFTVEREVRKIECDSVKKVANGSQASLTVSILPAAASAGKTLNVHSSSSMILSTNVTSITINENGKANIDVFGELPGTAALTFTIDGYDISATTIVKVEQLSNLNVAAPTANIESGTEVEKGTEIILSCMTEGAVIYYTLDGSCPCDEDGTRILYDIPIVINDSVTIKAMATAQDMFDSEIAEFVYNVKGGDAVESIYIDGKIHIYPLPVRDVLNISAIGKIIKKVTITNSNGISIVSQDESSDKISMNVSTIASGIYIVVIQTNDGTYSNKILKTE